jgi:hypothetical protein
MSLNLQAIGRHYGLTVSEWIESFPHELPIDAVGIWQIVPDGKYEFELRGDDLTEFVRLSVSELLAHGAKPVLGGAGTEYYWIVQPQYGETNAEILDAVINEWLAGGGGECDPGGLWFALPSLYNERK